MERTTSKGKKASYSGHDFLCYSQSKAILAYANQNRDYRIFKDFAFYIMKKDCEKQATDIMEISGKKYAFDSTTNSLCLATFPWEKFRRKKGRRQSSSLI